MLSIGDEYTRDQIYQYVGGSKVFYLPTKDGIVVAACLKTEMNPRAPEVVLCGRGAMMERAAEQLARQSAAIPVFLKRDTNRWEYLGRIPDFRVATLIDPAAPLAVVVGGAASAT